MYSEYVENLDNEAKQRYIEKIKDINYKDPYLLHNTELSTSASDLPDVTYIDIVNYMVYGVSAYTLEEFKAYKSLQAYNLFSCGWVLNVFAKKMAAMCLVIGKVRHSQRLSEKPLSPWFLANRQGVIQSAHCTCMAGLGESCTHIAALMFFVQYTVLKREEKSVTSIEQYWGKPKKSVDFAQVKDIDFSTPSTSKESAPKEGSSVPEMEDVEFFKFCGQLRDAGCNSALLKVVPGFNDVEIGWLVS
ncbi:uncharacterized protein LOC129230197 [Uloborus diversus]|uniref:uncharacterized protein LOC129230197 n=1 Tax=Uloborus diversus TaxID=327109 RepID=UPI00240938D7|nr:uncharacterized protein LOC129230197 [Uloborus diversus]